MLEFEWKRIVSGAESEDSSAGYHTAVLIGSKIFVYGGYLLTTTDALYSLDYTKKKWTRVDSRNKPVSRCGHGAVLVDDRMLIMGGWSDGIGFLEDSLYSFDICLQEWFHIDTSPTHLNPRYLMDAHYVEGTHEVLVFGGKTNSYTFSDLTTLDPISNLWRAVKGRGKPPRARAQYSSCIAQNTLYVFGGEGGDLLRFQDLFIFDCKSRQWNSVEVKGKIPKPLFAASLTKVEDKLIMFGGYSLTGPVNDMYIYDIEKETWSVPNDNSLLFKERIEVNGDFPRPMFHHEAVKTWNKILFIGGLEVFRRHEPGYYKFHDYFELLMYSKDV